MIDTTGSGASWAQEGLGGNAVKRKTYLAADTGSVKLTGGILRQYQEIVREKSMPYQWEILNDMVEGAEKSGAIENFRIAAGESDREYYGTCFQDSDVGKWLEGTAYLLSWTEDEELEARADEVIELLGRAQQPDGYLNTYFTVVDPGGRFQNIRECDELYCFGHLAEAAVAYYQATGKARFLEIVCRYADLLCETFGDGEGQIRACDGHPEAELAFVRLYEATGEKRYLEQAGFQLNTRGSEPYYYDLEWERRGRRSFHPHLQGERPSDDRGYDQSECPVRDLDRPVGHAVKMCYLLAGMAAYSMHTGDAQMYEACRRSFHVITARQMYVTGAVGATRHKESFTKDYHLPNDRAYAETCASAAMVFTARRMLQVEANPYYADVMERVIYNALPAGMSLSGNRFFYVNPLEVYPPDIEADHDYDAVKPVRQKWFWCACCPPNLIRLVASMGAYFYTYNDSELYVNLFADSEADIEIKKGHSVHISQKTDYPWEGSIRIGVEHAAGIRVGVRVPSWCGCAKLRVRGACGEICLRRRASEGLGGGENEEILLCDGTVEIVPRGESQYVIVTAKDELLELYLELDMTPYCVTAHPKVKADAGKVAVMRGPVVYCAEETDNGALLHNLAVDPAAGFTVMEEKFWGAPVLCANGGCRLNTRKWEDTLYARYCEDVQPVQIRLIPYSMWGNRERIHTVADVLRTKNQGIPQEMQVWINMWNR